MIDSQPVFRRDRFTWLSYGLLGYFAYLQAALGPLMPFLRAELRLNYARSALHFSAFALGMMLAGLWADDLAARAGRSRVYWGGGLGMGLAALLFATGLRLEVTLLAAFLMSLSGTMLVIMIQATLSEQHGRWRGRALTEANLAAGITAGLAPPIVGLGESLALGWRGALVLGIVVWLLVYGCARRRIIIPPGQPKSVRGNAPRAQSSNLPRRFWLIWLILVCGVSIEWCMIYWASTFLEQSLGLTKQLAASALGIFFLGGVLARFAGSRLARSFRGENLLVGALIISSIAFPFFWLSGSVALSLIGLFFVGLGVANLFPFALVAASAAGQAAADRASARIAFGNGCAILFMPQLLGSLADGLGVARAYGIVALLLALAFFIYWLASRPPALATSSDSTP